MLDLQSRERCPVCFHNPVVKEKNGVYELSCERHGYMAQAATEKMAVDHWNLLISFAKKEHIYVY